MSIRTADREVIRRQAVIQRQWSSGQPVFHFACPECFFRRDYATEQGAVNGAAAHLTSQHQIRLTLKGVS